MKKVKITVLKTTFQKDLAKEYGIGDLGVCPILNEGEIYYGDWIKKPGVAIVSCNDGLRPVIFKLEVTDIESTPDD